MKSTREGLAMVRRWYRKRGIRTDGKKKSRRKQERKRRSLRRCRRRRSRRRRRRRRRRGGYTLRLYKRVNDFVRSPFVGPVERLSRQTAKANAVSFYGVWSPFYGDRPPLPPALLAPGTLVASIGPIVSNLCICLIPPNVSSLTSFIPSSCSSR